MHDSRTEALRKKARVRPDDPHPWEELACALERRGRYAELLETLLEAASFHPGRRGLELRVREELARQRGVLGDPRLQHAGYVRAVAVSPRGDLLATAGDEPVAWLWDRRTGLPRGSLEGHAAGIRALDIAPDGQRVATGSHDRTARIHDLDSPGKSVLLAGHRKPVLGIRFFPDGSRVLTASADTSCRIYDATSGELVRELAGSLFPIQCCAVSPDGRRAVSGSLNRALTLWDTETGRVLRVLHGHRGWIQACGFSPDGARILSASQDGTCRLWDASTGKEVLRLGGDAGALRDGALSPDGALLAMAGRDGSLRIHEARSGAEVLRVPAQRGPLHACDFAPEGDAVLCGGADGTARLVGVPSGRDLLPRLGASAAIEGCFFLPGSGEVAGASADGSMRIHAARTGEEVQRLTFPGLHLRCAAVDPAARVVALGGTSIPRAYRATPAGVCHLWFPDRPLAEVVVATEHRAVTAVALAPGGDVLLTASEDRHVTLWDVATGEALEALDELTEPVRAVAFTPDGRELALATRGGLLLFELDRPARRTAEIPLDPEVDALLALESPEGPRLVAGCGDGSLQVISPRGRRTLRNRPLEGTGGILALAAAGPWILAGTERGGLCLLEARDLSEASRHPAPRPVTACAAAHDLSRLAFSQACHVQVRTTGAVLESTPPPR